MVMGCKPKQAGGQAGVQAVQREGECIPPHCWLHAACTTHRVEAAADPGESGGPQRKGKQEGKRAGQVGHPALVVPLRKIVPEAATGRVGE